MPAVIAIGPDGRAHAPVRSDEFRPVIEAVRDGDMLDQLLLSPRCRNYEHADDVRKGIYRSARYYCSCGAPNCTRRHSNVKGCPDGGQRISCRAEVVTVTGEDGKKHYHVQFRLHDKAEAIRSMILKYGSDPAAWPYQAKRKRLKETS